MSSIKIVLDLSVIEQIVCSIQSFNKFLSILILLSIFNVGLSVSTFAIIAYLTFISLLIKDNISSLVYLSFETVYY